MLAYAVRTPVIFRVLAVLSALKVADRRIVIPAIKFSNWLGTIVWTVFVA